jgi:NAD(P)-dependent dehydrogenase (short-subunit alcohol dehydrogenase family)
MKIFVAGASGAIGQPLVARLIGQGHQVTGMARSESGARKLLDQGACAELMDALDPSAVEQALRRAQPEAVWLPRFAEWLKAPPVPFASKESARAITGDDAIYYGMKLRGAPNAPRPLWNE